MRLLLLFSFALLLSAVADPVRVRVVPKGFDFREDDILAVIQATTREFWKYFPDYKIEPILVVRGQDGPITLFERNLSGEIIVRLDTHKTYLAQYSYQWAHEFCHILAGFRDDPGENKWFEESLCEAASLFALRQMSKSWEDHPPYPHWKNYRHSLGKYAENILNSGERVTLETLAEFYQKHREALRQNATDRELNGAIAKALLPLFEKEPTRWESLRYLNVSPAREGMSLRAYFSKWHQDAPVHQQGFIRELGKHFKLDQ